MRSLLPDFVSRVNDLASARTPKKVRFVDLGCGTGRNTLHLLAAISSSADNADGATCVEGELIGLDASPGMLEVARTAIEKYQSTAAEKVEVKLLTYDILTQSPPETSLPVVPPCSADGIISTLVLEHIPLDIFFARAAALLRRGGYFLVTNMHGDMGKISQAGFVDSVTGQKIRPTRSYAHEMPEVLVQAETQGFEVVSLPSTGGGLMVSEKTVTAEMVEILGQRAKKWIGVKVWFGICFRKR
jgi:SAM-dependent methyltransferase